MSASGRLIAVADLLRDDRRKGDRLDIASRAARQVARLCRCARGTVLIEDEAASVRASYPLGAKGRDTGISLGAGAICGTARIRVGAHGPVSGTFDQLDEWLLSVVAERVASQLEIVALRESQEAAQLAAHELQVAADLQRKLMAADLLECGGIRAAARTRPALRMGGDVIGLVPTGQGMVGVIGDVSGKGVAASVLTSALLATVTQHVRTLGPHPGAVLRAIAESLEEMIDRTGQIVTLAVAAVDGVTGSVRVASAGHHLLHIVAADGVRGVDVTDPPLGAALPTGREVRARLHAGEALVGASDGLTDQRDPQGRRLGEEGYLGLLHAVTGRDASALLVDVCAAADAHAEGSPQDDDQSIIVLGRVEPECGDRR